MVSWSQLPANGEDMWIPDAVIMHVKPCKTLEEEERDEDLKERTPYKFQILQKLEEQIKEQEFLEGQRIAKEERLKREKRFGGEKFLNSKLPSSIYYDAREHRTREDAIKFVKEQMLEKGVDRNGLPCLYRKSTRRDKQKPCPFKPLPPRITYHTLRGFNKTVKMIRRPYGCNPIVPNDICKLPQWIPMTPDEIQKFMREDLQPRPSEQPANEVEKVCITKEEILEMSDEDFRNLMTPDIECEEFSDLMNPDVDCHKPKGENELIRETEILMSKFRADVISSRTHFPDGESSKKYLNSLTNQQRFDYGVPPPRELEYRARRKLSEGSYPNWTVDEKKLPKVLRFAWKGKLKKLESYLKMDSGLSKINRIDGRGRSALHYAASWGDIEMLRYLLKCPGIDVNQRDEHGKTPLYKAVELGDINCVKALMRCRANMLIPARDSRDVLTFLLHFYGDERFELFEYLWDSLPKGAKVAEEGKLTYLHKAMLADKAIIVLKCADHIICDQQTNLNAKEGQARTALHTATILGRYDLVELLIAHKANPMHFDEKFRNPITYSAQGSVSRQLLDSYYRIGPGDVCDALFRRDPDCPINKAEAEKYRSNYFASKLKKTDSNQL